MGVKMCWIQIRMGLRLAHFMLAECAPSDIHEICEPCIVQYM